MRVVLIGLVILAFVFGVNPTRICFPELQDDYHLDRIVLPDWDATAISPSGHFRIYYKTSGIHAPDLADENANGIPDYIEEVGIAADSVRTVLLFMGYDPAPAPTYDGNDGYYGIFISNRGSYNYGINYPDGHVEIDDDYSYGYYTTGLLAMRLTVAHEYFHAVQRGYKQPNGDIYFFEMSSTWIEDVIVPNGNDYINWTDDFFNNPEQRINETDGYSIALFGHYLSTQYDIVDVETKSVIIRKMWEDYANGGSAYYAMDDVLSDAGSYSSSFIEAWSDFIAHNFFNGIDENFYFYEDQADADNIDFTTDWLDEQIDFNLSLNDVSVSAESFKLLSEENVILDIVHDHSNFLGKWVVVGNQNENNAIYSASDATTNQLQQYDEIHFLYGRHPDNYSTEVEISVNPIFAPKNLIGYQLDNSSIYLVWGSSPGPGDTLSYEIFRNDTLLFSTTDTTYNDSNFVEKTEYTYKVRVTSENGHSEFSNTVTFKTWPSAGEVYKSEIISVYPNPFILGEHSEQYLLFDSSQGFETLICEIFNIKGQKVVSDKIHNVEQGRQRIFVNYFNQKILPSGIYFVRILDSNKVLDTQKILLLK